MEFSSLIPREGQKSEESSKSSQRAISDLVKDLRTCPAPSFKPGPRGYQHPSQVEGTLLLRNKRMIWKSYHFSYTGTHILCYKPGATKPKTVIPVAFCKVDRVEMTREEAKHMEDSYVQALEEQRACFQFRVYAPGNTYFLRAPSRQELNEWVSTIRSGLTELVGEEGMVEKEEIAAQLEPFLKDQSKTEFLKFGEVLQALQAAGMVEPEKSPIASSKKEKEGYLQLQKHGEASILTGGGGVAAIRKRYYFVLYKGSLYYYINTRNKSPHGMISLRHCALSLDLPSVRRGKWLFFIQTPLRSYSLLARHDHALKEWLKAIGSARVRLMGAADPDPAPAPAAGAGNEEGVDLATRTLLNQLDEVNPAGPRSWEYMNAEQMMLDRRGLSALSSFLTRERRRGMAAASSSESKVQHARRMQSTKFSALGDPRVDFFLDLQAFTERLTADEQASQAVAAMGGEDGVGASGDGTGDGDGGQSEEMLDRLRPQAQRLFDRYLSYEAESFLELDDAQRKDIEDSIRGNPFPSVFDAARVSVLASLDDSLMLQFRVSKSFQRLVRSTAAGIQDVTAIPAPRYLVIDSEPVDVNSRVTEWRLQETPEGASTGASTLNTIGRDAKNAIMLEDSRVSRCHARVDVDHEGRCFVVDLGSTRGLKLNGKRVTRAPLKVDDLIRLGNTELRIVSRARK